MPASASNVRIDGKSLKEARIERGYTQATLAQKSRVSERTIRKIELRDTSVLRCTAELLATALDDYEMVVFDNGTVMFQERQPLEAGRSEIKISFENDSDLGGYLEEFRQLCVALKLPKVKVTCGRVGSFHATIELPSEMAYLLDTHGVKNANSETICDGRELEVLRLRLDSVHAKNHGQSTLSESAGVVGTTNASGVEAGGAVRTRSKLEYIWLDGYQPTQSLRSKTKVCEGFDGSLEDCPSWSFDGSSTERVAGDPADCLLKPVAIVPDPCRQDAFIVMTEVLNADGAPHESNRRATIDDDDGDFWFGFEQEYFLVHTVTDVAPGSPPTGGPSRQGPFGSECGARDHYSSACLDEFLNACLDAGINADCINANNGASQWEFQVFPKCAKRASDETWISRYLLERLGRSFGYSIEWHPTRMYVVFSNGETREKGVEEVFTNIRNAFGSKVDEHLQINDSHNDERVTGEYETQAIDNSCYNSRRRGSTIRIPVQAITDVWNGHTEYGRHASNLDPYMLASAIIKTVKETDV